MFSKDAGKKEASVLSQPAPSPEQTGNRSIGPEPQILWLSTAFVVNDGRAERPRPEMSAVRRGRAAPRSPRQDRREGRDRLRGRRSVFEMRRHLQRGHARAEADFRAFGRVLARSIREDVPRVLTGRGCDRGGGTRR